MSAFRAEKTLLLRATEYFNELAKDKVKNLILTLRRGSLISFTFQE